MDFVLSKEQEMARGLFRQFAETEAKPLAQEIDETERFPIETVKKMQKYGFMGIPFAKEYGGQGCDSLQNGMIDYLSLLVHLLIIIRSHLVLLPAFPYIRLITHRCQRTVSDNRCL